MLTMPILVIFWVLFWAWTCFSVPPRVARLTSGRGQGQIAEEQQGAHVEHHGDEEGGAAQHTVVRQQDEGLEQAEARGHVLLQGEVLLLHRPAARRVLAGSHQVSSRSGIQAIV